MVKIRDSRWSGHIHHMNSINLNLKETKAILFGSKANTSNSRKNSTLVISTSMQAKLLFRIDTQLGIRSQHRKKLRRKKLRLKRQRWNRWHPRLCTLLHRISHSFTRTDHSKANKGISGRFSRDASFSLRRNSRWLFWCVNRIFSWS